MLLYISPIIYFSICIFLLSIGGILTIKALLKYIKYFKDSNFLIRAFITVLIPDIVCIINFLSRDIYNLFLGKLDITTKWCEISAMFAIGHFISLFGGLLFIAYCTYKMSIGEIVSNKFITFWNICFWLFGLMYGIFLGKLNILGEFDGLYCCIHKNRLSHPAVIILTCIAIMINITTIIYYISSYIAIKKEKTFIRTRNRVKNAILYRGFLFFVSFFGCWSLMFCKLILQPFQIVEFNILFEMCASWTVKCMPIINSVILIRLFNIIEKKERLKKKIIEELSNSIENLALSV